ncbi:hypothetical protein ACVIW2_002703 [Bradyrhizobium huanghuaihaiense]|uniref:hypothetical protein n=1 Tax=Bradyrhizobium huanghuaihaiense TaxID=990078 RepID=UPI00035CB522|nr:MULTISPECIES: hypothetical protein [Bradyrhizobium]UWU74204.1 hypothetical protein N2603_29625 [Bradyrhizobium sp. CB3035]
MKEMQAQLELLRAQIADCERLQKTAKNQIKRDTFTRLLARYRAIAVELERAIAGMPPARSTLLGRKTKEPRPKEE